MGLRSLSYLLFLSGIFIIILAVIKGEASIALFLIFPVIYGSGVLTILGILLIMLGVFLLFLSPFSYESIKGAPISPMEYEYQEPNEKIGGEEIEKKAKFGGVVMIGPIPIVFGSDKDTAMLSVIIAILMILSIAIFFFFFYG